MRTVIQILITIVIIYVLLSGVRVFASAGEGALNASRQLMNIAVSAVVEPRLQVEPTTSSPENIQPAVRMKHQSELK
jgi:hypothetical protein